MTNHTDTTTKQQAKPVADDLAKVIWSAMGDSPVDILSSIKISNKALSWVGELSKTIAREAASSKPSLARIQLLAGMASYLSDDYEELGLSVAENLSAAMVKSGMIVVDDQQQMVAA